MDGAKETYTISVEGNIGAGKSTFLEIFRDQSDKLKICMEPIGDWQNMDGHNLLNLMYCNPSTYTFHFQFLACLTRTRQHLESTNQARLVERFMGHQVFIKNSHKLCHLTDLEKSILDKWDSFLQEKLDMSPQIIIYLRTTPEVVYQRMKIRNRDEEKDISLEYLKRIHQLHEDWLMSNTTKSRVIVVEADKDINDLQSEYETVKQEILKFVENKQ